MLGKLIRHEFKDTAKLMLLIYALFAVITLFGSIVLAANADTYWLSTASEVLLVVTMIFYGLSIFALFIVTYVYICVHFYKTMFSSQGYLTHTLPIKTTTIFHVKLGVSLVWLICSMALLILSLFLLAIAGTQGTIFHVDPAVWTDMVTDFEADTGFSFRTFFGILPVSILLSCLVFILMVYTSSCIGQLFSKNKVAASVIAGVILYFVEQIVSSVLMVISNANFWLTGIFDDTSTTMPPEFLNNTLTVSVVWSLCFCVVYYIVCRVILQKHLNLE